jgi:hypothetical protein
VSEVCRGFGGVVPSALLPKLSPCTGEVGGSCRELDAVGACGGGVAESRRVASLHASDLRIRTHFITISSATEEQLNEDITHRSLSTSLRVNYGTLEGDGALSPEENTQGDD